MSNGTTILSDLRTRLLGNRPDANTLALNSVTLPAGAAGAPDQILALIDRTLKVNSLAIAATAPTLSPDETTLTIEGQATILQSENCQVSIRFIVGAAQTLDIHLRAALSSEWRFSTSFPALATADLDYLSLSECLLLLTSYDHTEAGVFFPLTRGLSFQAKLKVSNKLVPVTPDLTTDTQTVAVGGAIDNSGETPQFALAGESNLSDLTFDVLSFGSMTMRSGQVSISSAGAGVANVVKRRAAGQLTFASRTIAFEVDLPLIYPKLLNLTIAEAGYSLSSLSGATNLIGGSSLTNYLPSQLTGMGAMSVSEFLFQFNPGADDYSHAAIKISSGNQEPFQLIPSVLSLRGFSFGLGADTYVYYTGLTKRTYRASIGGAFTLGDLDVTVTLTIPTRGDWIITLTEDSPQPTLGSVATFINQGIAGVIGPLPEAIRSAIERAIQQLGSLAIKNVEIGVSVSPPALSYVSFDIEQLEKWDIVSFLSVSDWKIAARLIHAGGVWRTLGLLTGKIMIGPAGMQQTIGVRLPIPAGEEGWTISLAAEPFTIPDLTHICYLVGIGEVGEHLPKGIGEIGNLTISQLDINFDPALANPVKGVIFGMHTNSPWNLIPDQGLVINDLLVSLWLHSNDGQQPAYVTGIVKGTVTVFGAALGISAQRITQADSWVFELFTLNYIHIPGLADLAGWMLPGEMLQYLPQSFMPFGQGFNLTDLNLNFDLSTARLTELAFSIRNAEPWTVIPGYLVLDDLYVTANITQPGQAAQNSSVHIEGAIIIAGVLIRISADKAKSQLNTGGEWQFNGATGPGQEIPIGEIIDDIALTFGALTLPSAISDLVIENLGLKFNTGTKNLTFTCEAKFPVGDQQVDITVTIDLINENGVYTKKFGGRILVGDLIFNLAFVQNNVSDMFVATYNSDGGGGKIQIKSLVEKVSSSVAAFIPPSLEIELKDVLFAFRKDPSGTKFLFGLDIGTKISLSELPLVGRQFPRDQEVGVDDLQILVASKPLTQDEVTSLNNIIGAIPGGASLPVPQQSGGNGAAIAIPDGLTISAKMRFGASAETLSLPVAGGAQSNGTGSSPSTTTAATTTAAPATTDSAKWFTLQKNFGPVTFNRVGVQYQDGAIWFLLDAALSVAGLTLGLDGLAAGSPLNEFHPRFKLRGLGIDYSNGPVEIGGAFLWRQIVVGGKTYDEYDGAAIIKTPQFALSAIGSYADLDGHPSLFVYAVLDYPLGGPAFFFVTGLAAGFGYNRSLVMPAIEQVANFPLVAQAVSGPRAPNNLETELQSIQQYIPPSVGEIFLAVGIKFTSFKIIDSFVLLTVAFGNRFEVNLLGLSTLISPPQTPANTPPLAVVQMAVRASFIPDEGFLGVQAQLTPASYIFTRDCHITGGFAFYSWFSGQRAGEFVITLGGYHPSFNVPDYYPRTPRLGVSWRVSNNLSIKGGVYYALTASALMAGGSLEATWQDGNLRAWFNAGADFIISWKPYYYDARIYVNMGVSYTFTVDLWVTTVRKTISVDVGANLHIWGPEFSGTAHISLKIISFDVSFGSAGSQRPQPIGWDEFRTSFLPSDAEMCGVAIKSGLTRTTEAKQWMVSPKDFCLMTDSMIPSKEVFAGNNQLQFPAPLATDFGIGSMEVAPANLSAKHKVSINRIVNNAPAPAETDFDFVPIKKKVPAGLWGKTLTPSLNGQGFIDGALSGVEIRPKNPPAPGVTSDIERANLQYDPTNIQDAYYWEPFKAFNAAPESDDARRELIRAGIMRGDTVAARNRLLQELGLSVSLTLSEAAADAFAVPPQVGTLAG